MLPVDPGAFQEVGSQDDFTIYAPEDQPPFSRVYLAGPDVPDDQIARYWPIALGDPGATCPADSAAFGGFPLSEDAVYVPAGVEPDLTPDALEFLGDADLGGGATAPIYAESTEQPFPELFLTGIQLRNRAGEIGSRATPQVGSRLGG